MNTGTQEALINPDDYALALLNGLIGLCGYFKEKDADLPAAYLLPQLSAIRNTLRDGKIPPCIEREGPYKRFN